MRGSLLLALCCLLAGCAGAPTDGTLSTPTGTPTESPSAGEPMPPDTTTVTVTVREVVDGDTLEITYENGTRDTVRLVGVDTPEIHSDVSPAEFGVPDTEAGRHCLRTWADRASAFATDRLGGRTVTLHFDPNLDRRGYYGRLLAYVTVDGAHVNYRLVRQGYARVYDSEFVRKAAFLTAEQRARRNATGLWQCASGGATTTARQTGLVVSVHADAAGNDNENLNGEYVTFENRGDTTLTMDGWTVADAAGHTYTFTSLELAPGETVTLYTGPGTDTASARYWGAGGAIWNNGGDTVVVRDASGAVVLEHEYEG